MARRGQRSKARARLGQAASRRYRDKRTEFERRMRAICRARSTPQSAREGKPAQGAEGNRHPRRLRVRAGEHHPAGAEMIGGSADLPAPTTPAPSR